MSRVREVVLKRAPTATPVAEDFEVVERAAPVAGSGQLLVRSLYQSLDPYIGSRLRAFTRAPVLSFTATACALTPPAAWRFPRPGCGPRHRRGVRLRDPRQRLLTLRPARASLAAPVALTNRFR